MKSKKNLGFTLVELIVSIAVLSIVTLGIGGLLRLAAENYSNATKETEVQNLLQATFASISNSLEDAAVGVRYDNGTKTLTVINQDKYIKFKLSGSTLYYDEGDLNASATDDVKIATAVGASVGTGTENILTDHVTSFNVDVSNAENGWVVLSMNVQIKERGKELSQNVFLRNFQKTDSYIGSLNGPAPSGGANPVATGTPTPTNATITNPPPGPGPGGSTPSSTPTPIPTFTPTPTPVDYTNRVWDVTPGATQATFKIKDEGGSNMTTVKITKDGNNYRIDPGPLEWVIANIMPGYYNGHNPLTAEQIAWLKDTCGIDVATVITGGSDPQDPNGSGGTNPPGPLTVVQDTTKTYSSNLTVNETYSGANWTSMKFTISTDSSNSTDFEITYRGAPENSYTLKINNMDLLWILQGNQKWNFDWIDWQHKPVSYNMDVGMIYDFQNAFGLDIKATLNPQN